MKQTIRILVNIIVWLSPLFVLEVAVSAQNKAAVPVPLSFTVVDSEGEPLPQAVVSVGEGKNHYLSGEDGRVNVNCLLRDLVSVSLPGYKTVSVLASVLADSENLVLVKDILFAGDDDDLVLPYASVKKRFSLGSTATVKGKNLAPYSSADIRNSFTGVLPGVEVTENFGQVGISPLEHIGQYGADYQVSVRSRGRSMMYLVDDVPVMINEVPLSPEQIESVTIIRDGLEKTMYGPVAADGIISIKTKGGIHNERYLTVETENGVNVNDRMPEFVSASQYAILNNLARYNSGLKPLYTKEDISAYALNDPYDKFHPAVDFKNMMLKNTMAFNRIGVSSGGGNDIVKYYAYLGYTGQDDIYRIGAKSGYDNVSISSNLDVKLHKYISAGFGLISSIGVRSSNNYGYSSNYTSEDSSSNTTLGVTELPDILEHINTIPQLSFPVYADNSPELESPYYAVTSKYSQNPIANILENGSYTETIRNAMFKVNLDVDLSFLLKGLSSYTYAAYASSNLIRLGKAEDYAAYILTPAVDIEGNNIMLPVQSSSHNVKVMSNNAELLDYYSNRFYLVEKLGYERDIDRHSFRLSGDFMMTKRSQKFITEHRREVNIGLNGTYSYSGKYISQFALNEHGTYSYLKHWSFSPAIGFGWIVSEEPFLKDNRFLDFLKFRVQLSSLSYDSLTYANRDVDNYSWNNSGQKFGPYSNNQWFGSSQSSAVDRLYASMLGNPNLVLEKRKEISLGLDLTAFDKRFTLGATYYNYLQDGIITLMSNSLPLVAGTSTGSLYMNYNTNLNRGAELSLSWADKAGDFKYSLSAWFSTHFSKILKTDELNYSDKYRSRIGKSASAIWGLHYIGQFATDEETESVPQLFDEELKAGDFKYLDMNGDGYVDDSDQTVIGDAMPKLVSALNFFCEWKGLDFSFTGTSRAFYDLQLTNSYFWNGWGDSNYSRYTYNNAGNPSAPRVTYNKVNNNFKMSEYWMKDGSFFKIQAVEIGYSLPVKKLNFGGVLRSARIYARANNLLTLSGIEGVDPEAINSGLTNYPLMKTFTGGIKLTF